MDNCSHNGEKLATAIITIAGAWKDNGFITDAELDYLKTSVSFPWSMIDKITPRPDSKVEASLVADGIKDVKAFVTHGGVYVAPFVNSERPEYLVIEDDFPNGRPTLEKAGILFTDRNTVNKAEKNEGMYMSQSAPHLPCHLWMSARLHFNIIRDGQSGA